MELTLIYQEGEVRVTREYGLPNDDALLRRLLAAIDGDPLVQRIAEEDEEQDGWEGEEDTEDYPEPKPFYMNAGAPKEKPALPICGEEGPKVRGFVLLACPERGKISSAHLKEPADHYVCSCGRSIPLDHLVTANFHCSSCGRQWKYKTNCEGTVCIHHCLNCGAEMQSWWNERKRSYHFTK